MKQKIRIELEIDMEEKVSNSDNYIINYEIRNQKFQDIISDIEYDLTVKNKVVTSSKYPTIYSTDVLKIEPIMESFSENISDVAYISIRTVDELLVTVKHLIENPNTMNTNYHWRNFCELLLMLESDQVGGNKNYEKYNVFGTEFKMIDDFIDDLSNRAGENFNEKDIENAVKVKGLMEKIINADKFPFDF